MTGGMGGMYGGMGSRMGGMYPHLQATRPQCISLFQLECTQSPFCEWNAGTCETVALSKASPTPASAPAQPHQFTSKDALLLGSVFLLVVSVCFTTYCVSKVLRRNSGYDQYDYYTTAPHLVEEDIRHAMTLQIRDALVV